MRFVFIALLLSSSISSAAETCDSAVQYLSAEAQRLEFPSLKKVCDYFDEVGFESEMDRAVYACRLLFSADCESTGKDLVQP